MGPDGLFPGGWKERGQISKTSDEPHGENSQGKSRADSQLLSEADVCFRAKVPQQQYKNYILHEHDEAFAVCGKRITLPNVVNATSRKCQRTFGVHAQSADPD